jgi:hypothetical protein
MIGTCSTLKTGNEKPSTAIGMGITAMGEITPFLQRILKRVGKDLVHITGLNGYKGICDSAAIKPNTGSFLFTYPQSEKAYSTLKPAVALFDFSAPWRTVSKAAAKTRPWPQFFFCHYPITLALVIQRKGLPLPLISYDQALAEVGVIPMKIPKVECWHAGPIPFRAIDRVLAIRKHPQRVRTLSPRAKVLSSPKLCEALWPHLPFPLTGEEEHLQMWLKMWENVDENVIADVLERARQHEARKGLPPDEQLE